MVTTTTGAGGKTAEHDRPGMHLSCARRALRYEGKRLSSLRSPWILAGIVVLIGIGNGIDIGLHDYSPAATADVLQFAPLASQAPMSAFLLFAFGATAISAEYAHQAARSTFLTLSSRRTAYAAKVAVTSVTAAAVALGSSLLGALIASGMRAVRGEPSLGWLGLPAPMASFTVVMLCWPALAAGLTALVRNRLPVIMFLLLWPLVLERLVGLLLGRIPGFSAVPGHLPFAASRAALYCLRGDDDFEDAGFTRALLGSDVHPALGLLIFCAFTVGVVVAGGAAYTRRDV
ncbi:hypothetical protein AC230_14100 [Streptomyces caatingaensis]|uniref:ABC transporter permease n=1 Tax=Streptomyces caatingaensis TaxID=1678637 RepID=A0A0K9XDK1_9ACTN|nr:hypothetical protein AC230_14100 [Streptomyces caatingaensis]